MLFFLLGFGLFHGDAYMLKQKINKLFSDCARAMSKRLRPRYCLAHAHYRVLRVMTVELFPDNRKNVHCKFALRSSNGRP